MSNKTELASADKTVYVPLRGFTNEDAKKPRTAKQLAADKRRKTDNLIRRAQRAMKEQGR